MASVVLWFAIVLVGQPTPSESDTPREPNPLAPSLPLLTEEEEAQLDSIIDQFILYDTGQLLGEEGKQALSAFQDLGPEATFALMRGLNKAANIEHSCPALTIGRKLEGIFRSTEDTQLLEFAKENVGLGVESSKHMNVIKNLRLTASLRQSQLKRAGIGTLRGGP